MVIDTDMSGSAPKIILKGFIRGASWRPLEKYTIFWIGTQVFLALRRSAGLNKAVKIDIGCLPTCCCCCIYQSHSHTVLLLCLKEVLDVY